MLPLEGEQVSPFSRDRSCSAAPRVEQPTAGRLVLAALVYEQWTNHLRKVVVKLVVTSRNQLRTLPD
jgi:hypothetical protein